MFFASDSKTPMILALDVGGLPLKWLHWQDATVLYARNQITWSAGDNVIYVRGGINRNRNERTLLSLNSIISVHGSRANRKMRSVPHLNNRELFRRDQNMCMYCGTSSTVSLLTRDHVFPRARGGIDTWNNVVTACKACNHRKGCRTPEEAGMKLLAIPYTPNYAEFLILENRRILADQMEYLKSFTSDKKHY